MFTIYNTAQTLYTGEYLIEGVFKTLFEARHYLTRYSDEDKKIFIIK